MNTSKPKYESRPPFFAVKFCRLLAECQVANEIGANGCWLLTVIVGKEDALGYQSVTFTNAQLLACLGHGSEDSLARLRKKLMADGWLEYTPGRKGVAGTYFVTVPPAYQELFCSSASGKLNKRSSSPPSQSRSKDHSGAGRSPTNVSDETDFSPVGVRGKSRGMCGGNRGETADPSPSSCSVSQKSVALPGEEEIFTPRFPPTRSRNELFDAIAEVTQSDPKVNGSEIGKLCAELSAAEPPYTPAEVRRFADPAFLKAMLPWMTGRLGVGLLRQNIRLARSQPTTPITPGLRGAVYDVLPTTMTQNPGG